MRQAIERLRRAQPRNADTMLVCDELERLLKAHNSTGKATFDRNAYQREYMREYMRKRRAKPVDKPPQ